MNISDFDVILFIYFLRAAIRFFSFVKILLVTRIWAIKMNQKNPDKIIYLRTTKVGGGWNEGRVQHISVGQGSVHFGPG